MCRLDSFEQCTVLPVIDAYRPLRSTVCLLPSRWCRIVLNTCDIDAEDVVFNAQGNQLSHVAFALLG